MWYTPRQAFQGGRLKFWKETSLPNAPPFYPWDAAWMLNWFTFPRSTTDHGKCLGGSPGSDSLSATNFDCAKESHFLGGFILSLGHWWSHWGSSGTCNFYLSSLTSWRNSAALRRAAKGTTICRGSVLIKLNFCESEYVLSSLIIIFLVENIW